MSQQSHAPRPGLRRDAERNRQRLLDAGRELFAERGMAVSLNDIAHHAGVGVGTAYRRFANKEELLDAIYLDQIADIAAVADNALADADPWRGLERYLVEVVALQARDRGLAQILAGSRVRADLHNFSRDTLAPRVERIAARAEAAGVVRDGFGATDLIFLQVGLMAIAARSAERFPELYRRYLQLALDSIKPGAGDPLPVPALTTDETHQVMGGAEADAR